MYERHAPCLVVTLVLLDPPNRRIPTMADATESTSKRRRKSFMVRPVVGLIGVEPTTSSLSGMRSNQLSYSPLFGTLSLRRVVTVRLENDFFFKHADTYTTDELRNEIEHHGTNHPQPRAKEGSQESEGSKVCEQ